MLTDAGDQHINFRLCTRAVISVAAAENPLGNTFLAVGAVEMQMFIMMMPLTAIFAAHRIICSAVDINYFM
ncbi:hypothetical protein MUY27_16545 [Mucilaginibacter sp. RS28]|uniref:Uncharacterized protein n=1 Tax=Mucilaginibacter straminoryzae TaxID=2932774 RepID=A0A9X1X5B7_9SPHI|nr:hypothetical protein [Mucilaginibacter straminoryzae]MCJ8211329.1 hypothetical protein [Mucilaginibacter straminoryzae]